MTPTPIRDASHFMIGASVLRQKTIEATGNMAVTLEAVALAAGGNSADAARLRQTITLLGDREQSALRNTPPHTLATEKIVRSRANELAAFAAVHGVVVTAAEQGVAADTLREPLLKALTAIDAAPGSANDRSAMKQLMVRQMNQCGDASAVQIAVSSAEKAFLDLMTASILSRYENKLDRSNDFEF